MLSHQEFGCHHVGAVLDALDELADVSSSQRASGAFDGDLRLGKLFAAQESAEVFRFRIVTLNGQVFDHQHPSVDKFLFRQEGREDRVSVILIAPMQIFSLHFLLSHDVDAVQHAKLWNVVEHLEPIVLLVLNWAEAEVELRQQLQVLDVAQLENFLDLVEAQVEEAQFADVFEATQVPNVVSGEVQSAKEGKVSQSCDFGDLILRQVKLLKVNSLNILDLLYPVL